jgi:hypothetical protein
MNEQRLKWVLMALGAAAIGYWGVPILNTILWNWITLGFLGIAAFGILMLLPAACEFIASLGWRAWEQAIRQDPVTKLKREHTAYAMQVDEMRDQISTAMTRRDNIAVMIKQRSRAMLPDALQGHQATLAMLNTTIDDAQELYRNEVSKCKQFELAIEAAEADYAVGGALKAAAGSFKLLGKKSSPTSLGSRVAFDAITQQLGEARNSLQLTLDQRKLEAAPIARVTSIKEVKG